MGVSLSAILEPKQTDMKALFDKKVAVDSFNWLYQFLSTIRQSDGTPLMDASGNITSHLSGLFYRTIKLMENNIKTVYVFDGEAPKFKKEETEKRKETRQNAKEKWGQALKKGDMKEAKKYAQGSSVLSDEMIEESKELLEAMGVPIVQAPSEGEAQCAYMVSKGHVHAVASQDYDSLLFGAPRVIRNLSITGRRKRGNDFITISPESVLLNDVLNGLGITKEQLIIIGLLIGTDYNPGIKGIGPKKALDIVKMENIELILDSYEWNVDNIHEIYEFFLKPVFNEVKINFGKPNHEKIKAILCDKHDFSYERVENALNKLNKSSPQKSLSSFG